jgi:hypothetical protein
MWDFSSGKAFASEDSKFKDIIEVIKLESRLGVCTGSLSVSKSSEPIWKG